MSYRCRISIALFNVIFLFMLFSNTALAADDRFLMGYVSAVLEREFNLTPSSLNVEGGMVILNAEEIKDADRGQILDVLSGIQGVRSVKIVEPGQRISDEVFISDYQRTEEQKEKKLPEKEDEGRKPVLAKKNRLFDPLIADPRWPHFSLAYQNYTSEEEFGDIFAASFGETLHIYQDDGPFDGQWQVGIQAAAFIVHDLDTASWDLINEDYRGGVAFFYRRKALSGLFSIYHNSSHVGDEFLLRNDTDRVNFSYEAVQIKLSYDIRESYRVYGGFDYLFSPDPEDFDRWFTQYGIEFRCPRTIFRGVLRPVAGADFQNRQENDWHSEISLRAGLEIESEKTLWNKIHFMLEYYNGNSPNGQFHDNLIEYVGFGTHFYF